MTKIIATTANFNRPLYQSKVFIRTLNIFSILFELPTIDSAQKIYFKAHFLFSKKCKGVPLTKTFPTPANFNGLLYQCQNFIRTFNIFSILFELPTIDSAQKIYFKAHFLFSKKCKGVPLTKIFQLLQTLTGYCTKVRTSFQL